MEKSVFLLVPNIIGYLRIFLAFLAFFVSLTNPWLACTAYFIAVLLDEVDGMVARHLNQCSAFGAVLDIVTDRVATTGLMVVLGYFYPTYLFVFQFLIALDISSHWIQMYSSLQQGDSSHKVTDLSANPIMRFYYRDTPLRVFCIGNEVFNLSLYMLYFSPDFIVPVFGSVWKVIALATCPIAVMKHFIHAVQLVLACQNLGRLHYTQKQL